MPGTFCITFRLNYWIWWKMVYAYVTMNYGRFSLTGANMYICFLFPFTSPKSQVVRSNGY